MTKYYMSKNGVYFQVNCFDEQYTCLALDALNDMRFITCEVVAGVAISDCAPLLFVVVSCFCGFYQFLQHIMHHIICMEIIIPPLSLHPWGRSLWLSPG